MVWLIDPSEPIEPISAAYVLPPSAFVPIKICGPQVVEVSLPPSVQPLKLSVPKLPLELVGGTTIKQSSALEAVIRSVLESGKTVTFAVKRSTALAEAGAES